MIPLPVNPNITVLVDENNKVLEIATNVAPDVKVTVTRGKAWFEDLAKGKSFRYVPEPTTYTNC